MNRFPTLIKGTTRGEELSFKLSFVAIGPLVLALRRVQTDGQTDGQYLFRQARQGPKTTSLGITNFFLLAQQPGGRSDGTAEEPVPPLSRCHQKED